MSKPMIPWMGGKRRLAKHILPLIPPHDCYVEPFAGGAAIFFMKPPVKTEVLNDINGDIVNLYRVAKHHLEEFCRQFKHALVSRQIFEWLDVTPPETLTDIQKAARFFYLQKMSFGAKATGRVFGYAPSSPPRLNLIRIEEELSEAHLRLSRVYIENLDWEKVIEKYDRPYTFFYLDPPYWRTTGYGMDFPFENYEAMAEAASKIKGKLIISINDHPDIRRVFGALTQKEIDITYTVGGAKKDGTVQKELIISNW